VGVYVVKDTHITILRNFLFFASFYSKIIFFFSFCSDPDKLKLFYNFLLDYLRIKRKKAALKLTFLQINSKATNFFWFNILEIKIK